MTYEYEFCDNYFGGYTAIARKNDRDVFTITSQVFSDRVLCQVIFENMIYGFSASKSLIPFHEGMIAQSVMLKVIFSDLSDLPIPGEVREHIELHLLNEHCSKMHEESK